MSRRKVRASRQYLLHSADLVFAVDENLYYRGIHKQEVAESRRDQAHGLPPGALAPLALPPAENAPSTNAPVKAEQPPQHQPPYLFRNAAGLVRLTQQHNVRTGQPFLVSLALTAYFARSLRLPSCAVLACVPTVLEADLTFAGSGKTSAPSSPTARSPKSCSTCGE